MAVAIERPAEATTVGRPRRSTAASSTSSCTSVALCTSSTATAARSAASRPDGSGPAATKTSSGRRRLPPAAIVAPACSPSVAPCEWAIVVRRSSRSRINPGTCAPPASTTAATASALATYVTVPWCRAMIPPAVRIQPTSRQPAATSSPASACGPGNRLTEFGR